MSSCQQTFYKLDSGNDDMKHPVRQDVGFRNVKSSLGKVRHVFRKVGSMHERQLLRLLWFESPVSWIPCPITTKYLRHYKAIGRCHANLERLLSPNGLRNKEECCDWRVLPIPRSKEDLSLPRATLAQEIFDSFKINQLNSQLHFPQSPLFFLSQKPCWPHQRVCLSFQTYDIFECKANQHHGWQVAHQESASRQK